MSIQTLSAYRAQRILLNYPLAEAAIGKRLKVKKNCT
jgi:hypothetical protein